MNSIRSAKQASTFFKPAATVDLFNNPDQPCNVPVTECGLYLRGIDLLQGMLGTRNAADLAMRKVQKRDPSPRQNSKKMNFPGHRQKSYAWDAKTAVDVVMNLPGERARKFREVACKNIVRFLGGDQTLHEEIDANAAATSSEARFFQRSIPRTQFVDDWDEARLQSKESIIERAEMMKNIPFISPKHYAQINNRVNQMILGFDSTTKHYKVEKKIPRRKSLAEFMNTPQLRARALFDALQVQRLEKGMIKSTLDLRNLTDEVVDDLEHVCTKIRQLEN
jgi:hypothetical protein